MKRFLPLIIVPFLGALALVLMLVKLSHADTGSGLVGSGSAVATVIDDSGSGHPYRTAPVVETGSGSATPKPSDVLADPTKNPVAVIDDLKQAKRSGWPVLVLVVLIGLTKAASFIPGAVGKWFATGKRAMVVAGVAALAVAMYDVVALGGSWYAAGFAALTAIVGLLSPKAPVAAREKAGTA